MSCSRSTLAPFLAGQHQVLYGRELHASRCSCPPCHGLQVVRWVPVRVVQHQVVGTYEVEACAACPGGQQEHLAHATCVEVVHLRHMVDTACETNASANQCDE